MIRRKNYRSDHSLELGNHGDFSHSLPVRKLTSMKVVKYLILILIGVLIHTTYRAIFYTGEDIIAKSRANMNEAENLPADQINQELKAKESERVEKPLNVNQADENVVNRGENNDARGENRDENKKEENQPQNAESMNKDEIRQEPVVDENKQKMQDSLVEIAKKESVENKQEQKEMKNDNDEQQQNAEIVNEENKNDNNKQNMENNEEPVQEVIHEKHDENQKHSRRIENLIPQEFKELMEKVEKLKSANIDTAHGLPTLVTYGTRDNYEKVKQLVASIQDFLPNTMIYVYDLNMDEWQKNTLKAGCHVRVKKSNILIFPEYISSLRNYHWRPLLLQMALAHFRHIMWLEPGIRIKASDNIRKLMQSRSKVLVIGQKAIYTTNAVTNYRMYKYIPTNKKKMQLSLHIEPKALIIHNEDWVFENFLRAYVACALEEKCQAPLGSEDKCVFDVTGTKYASCHKYDESSLNIILKNYFDFDISKFYIPSASYFTNYNPDNDQGIKMCRNPNDVKNL